MLQKQTDGQLLTDYLAELRQLSATCDWIEPQIADNLCDKFVMGLKNERLLQQLLTKDHKKPLEELFQLALTFEAAEKESLKRANVGSASNSTTVAAIRHNKSKQKSGSQGQKKPVPCQTSGTNSNTTHLCASCGGNHLCSSCKFKNAKCHNYGKQGHILEVCRAAAGVVHPTPQAPDSAVAPLSNPQHEAHIPPMFQTLLLPGLERQLKLIVDSASPLTFVNSKTLDKSRLQSTTKVLGAFEGQPINPLGYFEAKVVRQDDSTKSAVITIYVPQKGINILGRDDQTKLSVSIDPTKFGTISVVESPLLKPSRMCLMLMQNFSVWYWDTVLLRKLL